MHNKSLSSHSKIEDILNSVNSAIKKKKQSSGQENKEDVLILTEMVGSNSSSPKDNEDTSLNSKDNPLISKDTANQTSNLFKRLKNAPSLKENKNHSKISAGSTLEEIVIESMKPLLKEWLDNNLSKIVEKVIEREVKNLIPKDEK